MLFCLILLDRYDYYPLLTDEETEAQQVKPRARGHTAAFDPGLSNPQSVFKPGCSGALQNGFQENCIALKMGGGGGGEEKQTDQTRNITFF